MSCLLQIQNLIKEYGTDANKTIAVNNVNFSIEKGDFVGIMGASGCGKSTLLNMISTIDKPTSGQIIINNEDISNISEDELAKFRRNNLGFIFQDYNLLDTLTLHENIALSLVIQEVDKNTINETIYNIAQKLGIETLLNKYPYEVSRGQCQRCACARAISQNPQLILADEPTGALDSHSAKSFMDLLVQLNQDFNVTILMVTHDAISASYCQNILFMQDGEIKQRLAKGEKTKGEFFRDILKTMAELEGDKDYVF